MKKAKRRSRRYGAGGISRRPSGAWQARLRTAGTVLSRSLDTREAAEEWLRLSKPGKVYGDVFGIPDRVEKPECTFAEAAKLLPAALSARGRTADSIRGYRSHRAAVLKEWGLLAIADTRPALLHAWIAAEQKNGCANRTNPPAARHVVAVHEGRRRRWLAPRGPVRHAATEGRREE